MNTAEYVAAQTVISAAIAKYGQQFGKFFIDPALSTAQWLSLLQLMYPEVERRRAESASLAREFYDDQRAIAHPDLPRNDRPLEGTEFKQFVMNMQPVRQRMSQADSPGHALKAFTMRLTREVENAGRQQIIHAVDNDVTLEELLNPKTDHPTLLVSRPTEIPEPSRVLGYDGKPVRTAGPQAVKGWARVATGNETCAWCLMLISRGPVYGRAESAGLEIDLKEAAERFKDAGQDYQSYFDYIDENGYMEEWHTGCDCKVVPVFSTENWPGKAAQKRAEDLWIDASKEASELIESGESRTNNKNLETQNALRRRLYRGEIDPSEYAFG
ncbi:head maturation protease [Mycobacterium phage Anthony]|uniref:MuF-like minor capsid protein n=1 Tax=Mycobacterium phage Anthony TaxID=2599857 RepID=A0A5J6TI46_9CAUD|nr:head maturation protease [Mycobacterium phage Anthony]QFG10385.1 MuF-like minor capsid protein [Mycobacterium phage Anthony]